MRHASPACSLGQIIALVVVFAVLQPAGSGLAQSGPDAAARAQRLDELFARLKAAENEYEGGKIEAKIYELWHQSGRPEIDELSLQAMILLPSGQYLSMLRVLDEIVQRAPDWAEGWNMRATAHYLVGTCDGSLADIDRVLALEPRHFGALSTMGHCHMHRGQYREALSAFRKALAINPFLQERLDVILELEKKVGDKPH